MFFHPSFSTVTPKMWSLAQKKFNRWSWWVFKLRFPYQAFHANKPGILGRCFPPGPAPHTRLHQGRIKPLQSNQPQNLFVILISSYHSMEKSAFHQCQDSAYQTNAHSRSYLKPHCQSPGKCTHRLYRTGTVPQINRYIASPYSFHWLGRLHRY